MLNWEELKLIQNEWVTLACEQLMESGHYMPRVFLVTEAEPGQLAKQVSLVRTDPQGEGKTNIICVPFLFDNPTMLLDLMASTDAKFAEWVTWSRATGLRIGQPVDYVDATVLRIATRQMDCEPKDILSHVIRQYLKQFEAYAILFISEAWMAQVEDGDEREKYDQVKDMPGRIEVLNVHLETRTNARTLSKKIIRETDCDEETKILRLEDILSGATMSQGRFADWFREDPVH